MAGPKKVRDALAPTGPKTTLHRFTAGSSLILEQLKNPIVGKRKPGEPLVLNDLEELEVCFVLSRPAREVQQLLEKEGAAGLRIALMEWADGFSIAESRQLSRQAAELLSQAAGTAPAQPEKKTG